MAPTIISLPKVWHPQLFHYLRYGTHNYFITWGTAPTIISLPKVGHPEPDLHVCQLSNCLGPPDSEGPPKVEEKIIIHWFISLSIKLSSYVGLFTKNWYLIYDIRLTKIISHFSTIISLYHAVFLKIHTD